MTESTKPPTWFWVVSGIALVWNLMGLFQFFAQLMMTPEMLESLPAEQQELYQNTPTWVMIAFAAAVFGGTLGCLALLLRKNVAFQLLVVSLAGVLIQNINTFFLTNIVEIMGIQAVILPLVVIAVGIYLVTLARKAREKGWTS